MAIGPGLRRCHRQILQCIQAARSFLKRHVKVFDFSLTFRFALIRGITRHDDLPRIGSHAFIVDDDEGKLCVLDVFAVIALVILLADEFGFPKLVDLLYRVTVEGCWITFVRPRRIVDDAPSNIVRIGMLDELIFELFLLVVSGMLGVLWSQGAAYVFR